VQRCKASRLPSPKKLNKKLYLKLERGLKGGIVHHNLTNPIDFKRNKQTNNARQNSNLNNTCIIKGLRDQNVHPKL